MKHFVIYSRQSKVSDLEGQMTLETADFAIQNYLNTVGEEGVDYEIAGNFTEIGSSYSKYSRNRIEFNKALALCYSDPSKYILLVSNMSRLTRNTAHGATLVEDLLILPASQPNADKTIKNIMLVLAESESHQHSIRRKAAYEAKRARCLRTGEPFYWGGNSPKWKKSYHSNKNKHKRPASVERAKDFAKPFIEIVKNMIEFSNDSFTQQQIADKLNSKGLLTSRGKEWSKATISRFLKKNNIEYFNKNKLKRKVA